ncbi:MAG TPA: hypothetical protein VMW64_08140 [Dehalococcoidia bacterium]|nr:hypothetical protein [Dehalococcoidia bacterium]
MLSWLVTVENAEGEVVFADTYTSTLEYIPMLMKIARLVNEKLPGGVVKVLCPEASGVIGYKEWHKDASWLTFAGGKQEELAEAARHAGLNYE